ncbi:MAG: hypothetical protein RLY45_1232 [Actinomycetota bacterium]
MDLVCTWLTGPDSGAEQRITWHPGPDGTTLTAVVGSAGHFHCDDPLLQPHHVAIEARALLEPDGTAPTVAHLWATQLAGTDAVHSQDGALRGRTAAAGSLHLSVAASTCRIEITQTMSMPRQVGASQRTQVRPVVRVARRVPTPDELAVAQHLEHVTGDTASLPMRRGNTDGQAAPVPERERPGGLTPTLVGLAGSAIVATVTGRPMFLLFGALGGLVALSSWIGQWIAFRRRHRRAVDEHRALISTQAADRAAARLSDRATIERITPSIHSAKVAIATQSPLLWACRSGDSDAFLVGLGTGDLCRGAGSAAPHGDELLVDVPVPAWLGPGTRLAVLGPGADTIARSIVVQLAARCGPADLRLVIDADDWQWAGLLPHTLFADVVACGGPADADDIAALAGTASSAHLVVVTTRMTALGDPASALRRLLDYTPASLIAISCDSTVPACATALLDASGTPAVFTPDIRRGAITIPVTLAGIGVGAATECATALQPLRDPEVAHDGAHHLPAAVHLEELVGSRYLEPTAIVDDWSQSDRGLSLPLGITCEHGSSSTAWLDLVADGPHALIAGTTGSGKSELLRSMVIGLARSSPPQRLSMVLVDYKGGATFDQFAPLPHVAAVVTDLDDGSADRMLRSLRAEMRTRESLLRQLGEADIDAARERHGDAVPPRLVVLVDEFAALVGERPSFLHALVGIAQRGRSLGLHLVLATQRPTGVISDDIRANTAVRIALRLHDRSDAVDVVGDEAPISFPRRTAGRAMLRDGDRRIVVQTARCVRLGDAVDAILAAAAMAGCSPAQPPWMPPLPERLDALPDVARTGWGISDVSIPDATPVIGIVDDPDHQRLLPLVIPGGPLGLIVAGSHGMGVSSTLAAVAAAAAATSRYERIIAIESSIGGSAWSALDDDGVVEHLGTDDDRLLPIMRHQLDRSRTAAQQRTLVILDGLDSLRRALAGPAYDHRVDHRHDTRFDQLLGALLHPDAHVDLAVGTADPASIPSPVLARCDERWVLHLTDAASAAALGVPPRAVPPPVPGRLLVAGLDAQVLAPASDGRRGAASSQRRTRPLPRPDVADLAATALHARRLAVSADDIPVGIDLETGLITGLSVVGRGAVLVVGSRAGARAVIAQSLCAAIGQSRLSQRVLHVEISGTGTGRCERDDHVAAPASAAELIVISGTGHDLRRREGWWTEFVRRARVGVVLDGPDAPADGELLGVVLPRGFPTRSHPHRAWLVDHGSIVPVHLAVAADAPTMHQPAPALRPITAAWRPLSGTGR